jgi:hypothetical protein
VQPSSLEILGIVSDVPEEIGKEFCSMTIKDMAEISRTDYDGIVLTVGLSNDRLYEKVRSELCKKYDIPVEKISSVSEIFRLPQTYNCGTVKISDEIPRGTLVDLNWLVKHGYIKGANFLDTYFLNSPHGTLHKWLHYFDIYDKTFSRFRGKKVTVLEIGVFRGGSLQMWREYFGSNAQIVGVDIDPQCKRYEDERISIEIGSQEDENFLKTLVEKYGHFDVIIDDGGHTMNQQKVSFDKLFGAVPFGGVYLCEDCHTSYWTSFGGGHKKKSTFIEFSKNLVDVVNQNYIPKCTSLKQRVKDFLRGRKSYTGSKFTNMIRSVSFYDSIVVVEKAQTGDGVSIMRNIPQKTI